MLMIIVTIMILIILFTKRNLISINYFNIECNISFSIIDDTSRESCGVLPKLQSWWDGRRSLYPERDLFIFFSQTKEGGFDSLGAPEFHDFSNPIHLPNGFISVIVGSVVQILRGCRSCNRWRQRSGTYLQNFKLVAFRSTLMTFQVNACTNHNSADLMFVVTRKLY